MNAAHETETWYKKKHEQKHLEKKKLKKNHTKYWHETHTKRGTLLKRAGETREDSSSFQGDKRRFVFIPYINSISARARLVFSMFSTCFSVSHTHTVSSPHQQMNCTHILLHSLHILQCREQKIQNARIENEKRVKNEQIFNRVKKEYEQEKRNQAKQQTEELPNAACVQWGKARKKKQ